MRSDIKFAHWIYNITLLPDPDGSPCSTSELLLYGNQVQDYTAYRTH